MVLERPQFLAGLRPSDPWRVKTGKIIVQVLIRKAGPDGQEWTLRAFWQAHRPEMQQFRENLLQRFPQVRLIEFTMTEPRDPEDPRRVTMTMPIHHDPFEDGREGGSSGQ
jgi:hypothetical protein